MFYTNAGFGSKSKTRQDEFLNYDVGIDRIDFMSFIYIEKNS